MKEYIELHSPQTLFDNYRGIVMYTSSDGGVPLGKHMRRVYRKIIEDIGEAYSVEINRVSPRKWQVDFISTTENSYNIEDDGFFLSPANFNLKVLTEQVDIYQYSALFGIHVATVSKWELEHHPELFAVYDESGKELSQSELEKLFIKENEHDAETKTNGSGENT